MLIFDETARTVYLTSLTDPIVSTHFWVLDFLMGDEPDFGLAPFEVVEKITCETMVLEVNGFAFPMPAAWNVLVYDEETTELDVVEVNDIAGGDFTALVHGPNVSCMLPGNLRVLDYKPSMEHICPSLNKHQMLCLPINEKQWITVCPTDIHSKYLKGLTVGDII